MTEGESPGDPDAAARAWVGRTLDGRYRVLDVIARGGMGAVLLAEHVRMKSPVALKVLHPHGRYLPEMTARFEREAVAGARVRHASVASAIDFGELEDGTQYLVLEHVSGITLRRLLAGGPLPPARAARIAEQVARALAAAHEAGVIHRDVKPDNVMVDPARNDLVKLIDFGLAKVEVTSERSPPALTAVGVALGTIAYLAPEAALGAAALDERSDLYGLGLLLYEMLAGRRPFDATEPLDLFREQREKEPPRIAERNPAVRPPEALEQVARRLLARERAARFPTALAAAEAIAGAAAAGGRLSSRQSTLQGVAPPAPAPRAPAPKGAFAARAREVLAPALDRLRALARAVSSELGSALGALRGPGKADRRGALVAVFAALLTVGVLGTAFALGFSRNEPPPPLVPAVLEAARKVAPPEPPEPPRPKTVEGLGADAWRAKLKAVDQTKDFRRGARAIEALALLDPEAFDDRALASAAISVAGALELAGDRAADGVFDVFAERLGERGLGLLFEMVRTKGGTKGGKRASDLLRDPARLRRASPALRIAFDLREARCEKKLELLPRAVAEGDRRALVELQIAREADCRRDDSPCCFRENREMAKAIKELKARLDAK